MKTIQEILDTFNVRSFKTTSDGLIAIRKGRMWLYFRMGPDRMYHHTGSTVRFES